MKKGIFKGIILVALMVSSVSSLISCKDYDEDVYADLKSRISSEASLREALKTQVDNLQSLVDELKKSQSTLLAEYLTKKEAEETYMKKVDLSVYLTKKDADGLYAKLSDCKTCMDSIDAHSTSIKLLQKAIDEINQKLKNVDVNTERIDSVVKAMSAMNTLIQSVEATAKEALELAKNCNCKAKLEELEKRLGELEGLVAGWGEKITAADKKAADALAKAEKNALLIEANRISIDSLAKVVKELPITPGGTVDLSNILERLTNLEKTRYTIQEVDDMINALRNAIKDIKGVADGAWTQVQTNTKDIADLESRVSNLETAINNKVDKEALDKVNARVDSLAKVTEAIEKEVDKLKNDIQSMITSIVVQATESPVAGGMNTPFGLETTLLAVYYGTPDEDWNFPSTKAGNYFNNDITKWTERNAHIMGVKKLSEVEGYVSGSGGTTLVTQKEGDTKGNAGTVYVTVNPANVDFTGKNLTIVDSKDAAAPVELGALAKSDRQLTFGFTRADNGFYEAEATITDVEKAKLNIDYEAIKTDAKKLLDNKNMSSALELGATLLKNMTDVTPAYGMMGSWTDQSTGTEHKVYSDYKIGATAIKPLSLAFLSDWKGVNKMPGFDRVQDMVGKIINKINVDIKLNLPDFAKYKGKIKIGEVKLPTISDNMFRIYYKREFTKADFNNSGQLYEDLKVNDLYFVVTNKAGQFAMVSIDPTTGKSKLIHVDGNGNYTGDFTSGEAQAFGTYDMNFTIEVDINKTPEIKQTLQDIVDSMNGQFTDLNKSFAELMDDVASLSNMDSKISDAINNAKNDIKTTINKYISDANEKLTKWFNRAPGIMHIALLQTSSKGTGLTSMSKSMPSKVAGEVKFVPTTYNLELIAPAYKKFVAVTDVFNADGSEVDEATAISMAAAVKGENMGKVFDGSKTCTMNAGTAGYIYEITYTAIDYFGKVAIRKYYVQF